ncbi:outer membrane lipoprotein [Microcystis phage Mwe-Yong1]|nr:outer membrane lipoprotein [Microcystis phage Mwe-Yong1]
MTHWATPLIGLPYLDRGRDFGGVDCWGLTRLAFETRRIVLPSYHGDYASVEERAEISAVIAGAGVMGGWREVTGPVTEFDVLVFRVGGLDSHVGTVVAPGRMLHIERGRTSCIERYDGPRWADRLTSIWRHLALERLSS